MAKKTTRDAALSRLFGNVAGDAKESLAEHREPAPKPRPQDRAVTPSRSEQPKPVQGRGEEADRAGSTGTTPAGPSGYIGLGRYTRSDGIVERITPYVRPDQAEALRIAVARKNDPRGTDISQIVQALLDEAGYRS